MCINGLNAEHEALLEQLELPEGISVEERRELVDTYEKARLKGVAYVKGRVYRLVFTQIYLLP